jgi:flagellar biosynthesis/type III secretory pathway chaperone
MEDARHLAEVLKSQISLYSELADLMMEEKEAIIKWSVDKTVEITKKKEFLLRREKIQEEARNALLAKISASFGRQMSLADVIAELDAEEAKELSTLKDRLVELITRIHAENLALRSLYINNSRLISDFFSQAGFTTGLGYDRTGANASRVSTMHRIG